MYYCSCISLYWPLLLERRCASFQNLIIVRDRFQRESILSLHVFDCCDTNPVFQVRFAVTTARFHSRALSKMASKCHWQNWINGVTHQSCGCSRRSLRCVPKHFSDLAHCAAEERWIVFSSMGEQYVIVPLLWRRSCRLLSVPSPKRRRRCTTKSLSANQRFLEV